jgi:MFS family permease
MQAQSPPVVTWFKVYAGAMTALYALVVIVGGALAFVSADWLEMNPGEKFFLSVICIVSGIPFTAAFLAAVFLPPKPWVWIYNLVLIAIGFGSCCILPASVALLLFWIRPETKAYFNRL